MRPLVYSLVLSLLLSSAATPAAAQTRPAAQRPDSTVLASLRWREIGPAVMGGRIADLAVVESNPAVFYMGTASGGLWKTTNHGTSWEPLFDDQPTASIGAVAVAQANPNLVWVGTGEPQNRQSSPWGNGVYRSTDGGRSWKHMGLAETRHIARIVVHPTNLDIVYVAAVGHLWGPNPERGVFRSTDGGITWAKVLYVDEHTGAIDLVMDPGDPQTLFAAMYQRRRTAWGFNGGGPGSGLHRTTDGGATWTRLAKGLPDGQLGRIGVDVHRRDGNLVYAVVEADPPSGFGGFGGPPAGQQRARKGGVFRSTDRGETWERMSELNPRPMYFSLIRIDPNDPKRIYLGGVQLHVSDDGGRSFSNDGARGVHSDHHALWIDPRNSDHLILGTDGGISVSFDRAQTWRMYDNLAIGQFYEIGLDMRDPYYVCGGLQDNGSWCGPSATHSSRGILNGDWYNIHGGDGFYTRIDPNDHTVVFAESQNGNVSRVDITTGERKSIRPLPRPAEGQEGDTAEPSYRWNWNTPIAMSWHDAATIYVGANVLLKSADRGMTWQEVSPDLTRRINRDTLRIMGALPGDSTLSRNDGVSSYGNITTISESPLDPRVVYVGTDDGNVQGTRDGGSTWSELTPRIRGVPDRTYVSRVVASRHSAGTVYAAFDGHYADDYRPYVFVSDDYGRTWRAIVAGLPEWSVNVIVEHPRAANLLFLGTEIGVYVSFDRGGSWVRLKNNLPTVPVDDIAVHPRENDLVIGTHGRSIWILDDITTLERLSAEVLASGAHLFPVRTATSFNPYSPQGWNPGGYAAANPPSGALIRYYLREDLRAPEPAGRRTVASGTAASPDQGGGGRAVRQRGTGGPADAKAKLTVLDQSGRVVRELEGSGSAGIQEVVWDLRLAPPFELEPGEGFGFFGSPRGPRVIPGAYTVRLNADGETRTAEIGIRGDPRITVPAADLEARQHALMTLYALGKPVQEASQAMQRVGEQLGGVQRLLGEHRAAPDSVRQQARELGQEVRELSRKVNQARGNAFRLFFAVENSTSAPTADQLWQLDRVWEDVSELVPKVNDVVAARMPALNRQLDRHGIRPDPGKSIEMPVKPER